MSSFTPVIAMPAVQAPDPSKHVIFSQGMVLGVDDFDQEFAYLSNRDQWLARDLLGYGTVCGLEVALMPDGLGVRVDPGVALNPRGQLIKVVSAQCASLTDWLNRDSVRADIIDNSRISDGKVSFSLVLCYRDCPIDSVPIPGEPCRTETGSDDSLLRASRIQDDYYLDFVWDAPDQTEEDALRDFVAWLRQFNIAEAGSSLDEFAASIRDAIDPDGFMRTPVPAGITIPTGRQRDYLRLAFQIWTTQVRPLRRGADADCVTPTLEDCVLLAGLEVPLAGNVADGWTISGAVTIDQEKRPYLLHLRFLQEWMLAGGVEAGAADEPTRILALSWSHGGNTQLDISVDGAAHKGVIVAFGKRTPGDDGHVRVEPGSLDFDTFQILVELPGVEAGVDFWTYRRILPDAILPIQTAADADGLVTRATQIDGPEAVGAALLLSNAAYRYMEDKKVIVVIKGDYVLDATGEHAIHASALRPGSPGGEGGIFESWMRVGLLVNVNTATAVELEALPGIGSALARRIVAYRTEHGPFTSIDSLLAVSGIGAALLNGIRPFITIGS